jgi:hypothetical protein
MQADAACTLRVRFFGIALCFLAALFFMEAKTAWASANNLLPTDIAASKAGTMDRSLVMPGLVQVKQPADDLSLPAFSTLGPFSFRIDSIPQRMDLPVGQSPAHFPVSFPFAQFDLPPPSC